jgi:RHS repeat-associated protein
MTCSNTDAPNRTRQQRTVLLATDYKNSVLTEIGSDRNNPMAYSAYGYQSAEQDVGACLGFNGEIREAFHWYFLGNGYRVYNPRLMCFHSPDSWSPFGEGGLNAYRYCAGDPVNFSDPTGHMLSRFKLFGQSRKPLSGASSTSSLNPLIANTAQVSTAGKPMTAMTKDMQAGITNPNFIDSGSPPIYENIPVITGMTPRKEVPYNPIPARYGKEVPPPRPSKQKPRFNDSGGQMGIISPNWKPNEPRRYRVAWESEPFQFPNAPVPSARTLSSGATREYYVKYDTNGNPTQSSIQKDDLSRLQRDLRNTKK